MIRRWILRFQALSLAARVAGVFFLAGLAWITLSDQVLEALAATTDQLTLLQMYKGWGFVLGSTVLLYVFVSRESRGRMRAEHGQIEILEHMNDVFFAVRPEWRITYANGKAEAFFDRTRDELPGRRLWDIYPQAVGERVYRYPSPGAWESSRRLRSRRTCPRWPAKPTAPPS